MSFLKFSLLTKDIKIHSGCMVIIMVGVMKRSWQHIELFFVIFSTTNN
jgi:hypothetical protein